MPLHASLGKFLAMQLRGLRGESGLLEPSTVKTLHAKYSPIADEALGWDLQFTDAGDRISSKTGSAGTFFAVVILRESRDIGIGVLINAPDQKAAVAAARRLLGAYAPTPSSVPGNHFIRQPGAAHGPATVR